MEILKANQEKIKVLAEKGLRLDYRKLLEIRDVEVEENPIKKAEGSARVRLGKTEVLAGVKLDLTEPYPDSLDKGTLIVSAELLPLSSPRFESGPPDIQTIEIARIVDRGIRESHAIDFKKLCVKKGEKVWGVFVDIYSMNDAGNLIDAAALAASVALKNAVFPKLKEGKVDYGELSGKKLPLDKAKLPSTLTCVKIGNSILFDPLSEEEVSAGARLSVAVRKYRGKDEIIALQKGGDEPFTLEEIENIINNSIKNSENLRKFL